MQPFNSDQCSFCYKMSNNKFHHVLVPSHQEQKLKTVLQKLRSFTSPLSSYPTCDKCRQEFITVHNVPESCFQILPIAELTDIKMDPELMIDDELSDNKTIFETDPVDFRPIGQDDEIKRENGEIFFIREIDEDNNMSSTPDAGTKRRILLKCEKCEKTFASKHRLKVHILAHTGERPFPCPYCPKAFRETAKLRIHIRAHTGERPYSCARCPQAFKQSSLLQYHIRTKKCWLKQFYPTNNQQNNSFAGERSYSCPQCPKTFVKISTLQKHIQSHPGEKPVFRCEECDETFSSKTRLKVHVRTHTGKSSFSCPHCQNAYRDGSTLRAHIRTHTGERPYSCPHCPKMFKQRSSLRPHIRTHTGERPFSCPCCPKAFKAKGALKQHILTHTD
ncbi:zinc finger protein 782-like isoform X2 [Toxorhynchites rutilus septentrionalis]|uniref:zinc finger protein 782-like isoform X2 n=1 Tax=Toxorhynchites rutilus septentrionalis TaxID=329112 RepID=UPI00247A94E4|nr:zinc finger protein 782-like isoform X2 [Toxorhynchites rutilus septentrionalis]